jgi:hypothetical protein
VPHTVTETGWEPATLAQLDLSGLFDAAWYLLENPDVRSAGVDPLLHFCRNGWREGRKPNAYFDPAWYLEQNPDVLAAGMNPLLHYLRHGDQEGRRPIGYFDAAWYRAAYGIPADAMTLAHFLVQRTSGRYAPNPELWSVLHLAPYNDDPATGDDPFRHFLDDTLQAGREPNSDHGVIASSGLLDLNYYLINGSDVHTAQHDPLKHFCRYGWRELRKPNMYFDTSWYLLTNPLVERLKINPLVHYILVGEAAGRRPAAYFDPPWYRENHGVPADQLALAHFLAHRRSQTVSPTPLFDVGWYVGQHADELGPNRDPFAHFLLAGTYLDIDPSPSFGTAEYRHRHLGRPTRQFRQLMQPDRDNPLVHHLRAEYR